MFLIRALLPGVAGLLAVLMLCLLPSGLTPASAGGTVQLYGDVYEDANQNGARDEGEQQAPSTEITVRDADTDEIVGSTTDNGFGFFLEPGTYTVETDGNVELLGPCVDSFGGFNPRRLDECVKMHMLWPPTTLNPVTVVLTEDLETPVLIGLRRPDAVVVAGVAIEEDHYANGDDVVALVNGVECGLGRTTNGAPGNHNFEVTVLGAAERDGCAAEGDTVSFEINGIPAAETVTFEIPSWQFTFTDLTASTDYAWFWAENALGGVEFDGTIRALIDGAVCGETEIVRTTHVFQPVTGFGRLIVPSSDVEPGCGEPGALVRFQVDGIDLGIEVPWEPGVQNLDADLVVPIVRGDADCNGETTPVDSLRILLQDANFGLVPCSTRSDLDCDGQLTPIDSLYVLRLDAGLEVAAC